MRKVKRSQKAYPARGGIVGTPAHSAMPTMLNNYEASKPIGVRADTKQFVTLKEFSAQPMLDAKLALLANLDYETQAAFTIARLSREPETQRRGILAERWFTRDEIIREVKAGSPIGQHFVQVEEAWVKRLREKVRSGEYKVRGERTSASGT